MGPDQTVNGAPREVGRSFYENTQRYWQRRVRNLAIPLEWQEVVIHAAITLKLNAFDDTAPETGELWGTSRKPTAWLD